jgi:hypothetical protein
VLWHDCFEYYLYGGRTRGGWKKPVDADTIRSFATRLKDAKVSFGVLFSLEELTGARRYSDAISVREKDLRKAGRVIAVIDADDLKRIDEETNVSFLDMLRREYEAFKFDIPEKHWSDLA